MAQKDRFLTSARELALGPAAPPPPPPPPPPAPSGGATRSCKIRKTHSFSSLSVPLKNAIFLRQARDNETERRLLTEAVRVKSAGCKAPIVGSLADAGAAAAAASWPAPSLPLALAATRARSWSAAACCSSMSCSQRQTKIRYQLAALFKPPSLLPLPHPLAGVCILHGVRNILCAIPTKPANTKGKIETCNPIHQVNRSEV